MPSYLIRNLKNTPTISPFTRKLEAQNRFKGTFYYVASFFRHASFKDLTKLYNQLQKVPNISEEFLKIFEGIQTKQSRIMAWYKLYTYIMECEYDTNRNCDIIDTIYDFLPPKYNKNYSVNDRPNINKPATRNKRNTTIKKPRNY
jgi:hypothetical protein